MKLHDVYLAKMMVLALLSSSMANTTLAADGHVPIDHSYTGVTTKHHIEAFATQFSLEPHKAMEKIVEYANNQFKGSGNGMSKFKIVMKYVSQMPVGDTTFLELVPTANENIVMQLTVHESAKTNPYFLLDALIEVRNMYLIDLISVSDMNPIYKKTHSHHQHQLVDYHNTETSLLKSLGIVDVHGGNNSPDHYGTSILSPMEYLEQRANAEAGSIFAQRRVAEMEANNFHIIKHALSTFTPIQKLSPELQKKHLIEYAKAKGVTLSAQDTLEVATKKFQDQMDLSNKQRLDALNDTAKKTYRQQVQAYKADAAVREEIVKTKSLPEMIKANDREGVAQAMEKLLPWSIMEPTEKYFWSGFIESVRRPVYDNATILFRGLDQNEKLQSVFDKDGKVVSGGFFSKRLTAGSGSHLFKLKGLPETFETFGTFGVSQKKRISPLTQPHSLTKMMLNHAASPNGSPFISLTYDLDTAVSFSSGKILEVSPSKDNVEKLKNAFLNSNGSGGLATIRMDPRRLIINSISGYNTELEVLASMFVFPDEVLYLEKGINYQLTNKDIPETNWKERYKFVQVPAAEYYARARAAVYQKTGIKLPENHTELRDKGQVQFINGIKNMETLFIKVSVTKPPRCQGVFKQ